MKKLNWLSYCFYGIAAVLYSFIVFNTLTNPQNPDLIIKPAVLIPVMLVLSVLIIIGVYICRKIKYKWLVLGGFTAILLFLQAVTIHYLSVKYHVETWDMGVVYNAAEYYVTNGSFDMGKYDYFLWFPNNSPLYNLFVVLFTAFSKLGITNTQRALNIVNALVLLLSAWMVEKTIQIFAGKEYTGIGLMLCVVLCPFSLYTVIAYTDTFSMLFLSIALLFYVRFIRNTGNRNVNLLLFSGAVAFGASLKVSILILAIAAVMDLFISKDELRNKFVSLILVITVAFGGFVSFKYIHEHSPFLPEYDYNYTIPHSHWVMMGLNGLGGYSDDDYQNITLQYPDKASRQRANIEEIIRRIEEKGVDGMVTHLKNKLSFIFSEGTFGACYKLDRAVVRPNGLHEYIIYLGTRFEILGNFSLGLFLSVLVFMVIGIVNSIRKKDTYVTMPALSLIGIIMFLLMWEARSRYILNFLPVFVLMAVSGIKSIFSNGKNN